MNQSEIIERLTPIFRDIFEDDALEITPETTAEDVDNWDSANQITILVACEQEFGIKFQTAETEGLRNVGELAAVIARKVK